MVWFQVATGDAVGRAQRDRGYQDLPSEDCSAVREIFETPSGSSSLDEHSRGEPRTTRPMAFIQIVWL